MKFGPFTIEKRALPDDDVAELNRLRELYVAATKDDLPTLQRLIADGFDFRMRDDKMQTLLHLAHRVDVVRFLIEAGCDPLALDAEGSTTLMRPGLDAESTRLLLAHGVDMHARDRYGHSALYRQCDFGGIGWDNPNPDALQVLLDAGAADSNGAEIEAIISNAFSCVTSAGEQMDASTLERFLRKYQRTD